MKSRPDRRQIWEALETAVAAGTRPVLATVLRADGSTPLEAGARAVVAPDGTLLAGTVGGGLLEGETLRRAASVIATGAPEVFDFHLHGPGGTDAYPICGGTVRVLLQPARESDLAAHAEAQRATRDRRSGMLTTIVRARGQHPPSIETSWREAVTNGCAVRYSAEADRELLEEPVAPAAQLLIVGAGHVGQALAAHARLAGFDLAVIDDREDLLDPENFPRSTRLFAGALAESVAAFPSDSATYIALVTRGHRADAEALAHCLRKPHAYLGMIGSRRKGRLMREHFLREGLATAEEFDRIHTPIGLEIGAETAPEIAVSIVAQLIAVKNRLPSP